MKDWPKELKRTPARRAVWRILEHANQPLTVMDIFETLRESGEPVWLSTVYRTLESFESYHLVNKNSLPHSEMAYYEKNSPEHRHYAVCLACHRIFSLRQCPLDLYQPQLETIDFQLVGHKIELYGYCRNCAAEHQSAIARAHAPIDGESCVCDHA